MTCQPLNHTAAVKDGTLVVGGITMMTPAWCVLDVSPLWGASAVRGEDLLIPGRPGLLAMPRRITGTAVSLPLVVTGAVNSSGVPYSNVRDGIRRNLAALASLVGGNVKSVSLTPPGGGTPLVGSAHVGLNHARPTTRAVTRGVLTLLFPDGKPD